ncbi:MAG: hypothetical protein GX846_01275 [Deltaproteobacteria bacterium]|jgi:hypothetical protein|nr:hypothetical protein [Deltaproteobacteria bacterium]
MSKPAGKIIIMLIMSISLFLSLFSGCKGSVTREKVDDTVEDLAGKKQVDAMKKMERDIGDIIEKQSQKMDNLDKTDSE